MTAVIMSRATVYATSNIYIYIYIYKVEKKFFFFEIKMVSRNDVSAKSAETRILSQCVLQYSLLH